MAQIYADEHERYLQEHRTDFWQQLQQEDPDGYLAAMGQQAADFFDTLMRQCAQSPEVKNLPYMEKVQALQSRRHDAEEIVRHALIYQPLPDE